MSQVRFARKSLEVGGEKIHFLLASEDGQPRAAFMTYEAFLDLAAALYAAIEMLSAEHLPEEPEELLFAAAAAQ